MNLLDTLHLTLYRRPACMVGFQWGTAMGFGICVGPFVLFLRREADGRSR